MKRFALTALLSCLTLTGCAVPASPAPPAGRLGLLLPATEGDWSSYRDAAERSARRHGFVLMSLVADDSSDQQADAAQLLLWNVSGIAVVPVVGDGGAVAAIGADAGVPVLIAGHDGTADITALVGSAGGPGRN